MLALDTLRSRWAGLLGTMVAVALGAALISGAASLLAAVGERDGLDTALTRYAAAPIVVQGARMSDDQLADQPPPPPGLAPRLAAVPGVTAAIPDVVFPAQLDRGPVEGRGWSSVRLAGASLVGGTAPAEGEVVVGRSSGLAPGAVVRLRAADGEHRLRVSGVLDRPGFYVSDRDAARWGTVRAVGLLVSNAPVDALAAAIRKAVGPSVVVRTGDDRRLAEPNPDRVQLDDATALLGISAGLAGFVAIFVVASTFAFAVSQRRREFALLRLVGAFPRQVRRMVYLEALLAGGAAAAGGSLLGIPLMSAYAWGLERAELVPSSFAPEARFWPLTLGFGIGLVVALLGSWTAARRAGRVSPVEAMREAGVERRPMTLGRWFWGLLFLAGAVAMIVVAGYVEEEGAIALTVFVGELFVVAFALLAPVLLPPVIRLVSWPLAASRGAEPLLVRQGALTAVRRVASTAAPVLVTVGVAGSMIGAIATLAHATDADLRARLTADAVVVAASGSGVDAGVPAAVAAAAPDAVVSAPLATTVWEVAPAEPDGAGRLGHGITGDALGVDPTTLRRTLNPAVVAGSLADLRPGTITVPDATGLGVGDTVAVTFADGATERLRVAAVVSSLQSTSVLLPIDTVRAHDPAALAPAVYVRGSSPDAVRAAVGGLGVDVIDRVAYADARSAEANEGNQLALIALLGVALLYTGLAIVNTLLMATFDRRQELALLRLSGATPRQGVRVVAGEAVLVVLVGVGMAVAATVFSLLGLANALGRSVEDAAPVVPWGSIGVSALVCLALALGATVLPAWSLLHRPAAG
ncbi:FtsX-like permease family protein [Cryptosporangium aurantiacum]|uniref:Putative ABC transport system permease protein n=1 Tax=Cryptosporangium aurantiacum TaxID=134849 RepID=A0A1M7Q642_9ACTN|nr:FtsX-like permease family protein [Cryptosporangium aurantiacum]SHN25883.1 putative ABC transport system permease protein [Cryptosporangium aurantiacum]